MSIARGVALLIAIAIGCAAPRVSGAEGGTFPDVLRLVQERGWRVDFKNLCMDLGLAELATNCRFRQLSVQDDSERGYPRGFNVSEQPGSRGYVVFLFHLNPLVGEFFVVSPQGELLRAYVRTRGRGYAQVPNEVIGEEFNADVTYWIANFDRLRRGL